MPIKFINKNYSHYLFFVNIAILTIWGIMHGVKTEIS